MRETLEFVEDQEMKKKRDELIKKGYSVMCLGCGTVYKSPPQELYDDGHFGRFIDMCSCGSDLFRSLKEVDCRVPVVKIKNNTIILKEKNFKYCKCSVGERRTGDASTECWANLKKLKVDESGNEHYLCEKSKIKIIILK